jgi:hypothetical protein
VRGGATWSVAGELHATNMNAAVLAPALVSEGRAEARGSISMSGAEAAKLSESMKVNGTFTISKAVIGSFDFARAIQSQGAQTGGRMQVSELAGKASYEKGAIAVRDVAFSVGALNAAVALDIDAAGALSGRVVADLKTPKGAVKGSFTLGGTVKDPTLK